MCHIKKKVKNPFPLYSMFVDGINNTWVYADLMSEDMPATRALTVWKQCRQPATLHIILILHGEDLFLRWSTPGQLGIRSQQRGQALYTTPPTSWVVPACPPGCFKRPAQVSQPEWSKQGCICHHIYRPWLRAEPSACLSPNSHFQSGLCDWDIILASLSPGKWRLVYDSSDGQCLVHCFDCTWPYGRIHTYTHLTYSTHLLASLPEQWVTQ